MIKTKSVGVSIPYDLLGLIDKKRGKVARSVFIVDILRESLESTEGEKT